MVVSLSLCTHQDLKCRNLDQFLVPASLAAVSNVLRSQILVSTSLSVVGVGGITRQTDHSRPTTATASADRRTKGPVVWRGTDTE